MLSFAAKVFGDSKLAKNIEALAPSAEKMVMAYAKIQEIVFKADGLNMTSLIACVDPISAMATAVFAMVAVFGNSPESQKVTMMRGIMEQLQALTEEVRDMKDRLKN